MCIQAAAATTSTGEFTNESADTDLKMIPVHRWDEIALEKITEMISRKIVTGDR